jgi:hypothetical protein
MHKFYVKMEKINYKNNIYVIKNRMKLAILFSGRIKNFKHFYNNLKNHLVSIHEVDYFVSYTKDTTEEVLGEFIKCYEPKRIVRSDENYFNCDEFPNPTDRYTGSRHNMMCMFLNRYSVYKLFEEYQSENNIEYDIILSCRTDFHFREKIEYDTLDSFIKNDFICIPSGQDHCGINDRFAFGNNNAMKLYMNCYTNLYELFKEKVPVHPETALYMYLLKMNAKIYRFHYNGDI